MIRRLRELESSMGSINVAVVGAGFVGRGLVHQLQLTPGMRTCLIVNRTEARARSAYTGVGIDDSDIVNSSDPATLAKAIADSRPAIAARPEVLTSIDSIDVVVEATGDVEYGTYIALLAIASGKHLVSLNYETDATVGPLLRHLAERNGVVYTGSDGDQPGVMMRLIEYVGGIGLDVVAAVNCKGFLDTNATPRSIRQWAIKQNLSLKMTTAFTDGTKMNVENACVANATGLVPAKRGMNGIETTLSTALDDFRRVLDRHGVVDYTLGGDFGNGVFVIGTGADPELAAPYLENFKMGSGPWYLFYRPWHLVQFETPISIAEAFLDSQPTIASEGAPVAEVVTIAKRAMPAAHHLDGIGGFDCYGEIDEVPNTEGLVPIGLAGHCVLAHDVSADEPIQLSDVEFNETDPIVGVWRAQNGLYGKNLASDANDLIELWSR